MNEVLLDTHAFIWYVNGNEELSKHAQTKIDAAIRENSLYLAAISLWEIGMLDLKKRRSLRISH